MKLTVNNLLSRFYNVIDKTTGERLDKIHYADDIRGIYHTYEFETRNKNIGIIIFVDDYITFIKKGNIELIGKNIFFNLLKRIIDKFTK